LGLEEDMTDLSRADADARVTNDGRSGAYVLRPSKSCTSGKVLTVRTGGKTKNLQIDVVENPPNKIRGGSYFHFRGTEDICFTTVRELIDHFRNPATFAQDNGRFASPWLPFSQLKMIALSTCIPACFCTRART
jgi:hypothetical protein